MHRTLVPALTMLGLLASSWLAEARDPDLSPWADVPAIYWTAPGEQ